MRRARITITLNQKFLGNIDSLIDEKTIRNRSHAIEYILGKYFGTGIKKAVILAGGQGTKLRPYTYEVPKSLLPIKGKPILEYIIENLKANHIYEIIICTGYLGQKITGYFGDGKKWGVQITYSHENEALKTGGALLRIKKLIENQPFILIHGDILTNFSLSDLVNFHFEEKSLVTVALKNLNQPESFGQFTLHGTQLIKFYQHNKLEVKSHLVNTGIYVFKPEVFNYFPKDKKTFLLEDVIEKLINEKKVKGFVFNDQWFDVGNPKNYEKAIKEFLLPNQK